MVEDVMWLELHVKTTAEHANQIGDQLTLLGATALTMQDAGDQPIYEPALDATPLWQDTIVVGLFDDQQTMEPILAYLKRQQALGLLKDFQLQPLADQDWERRCLDDLKPLCFGKRLWVCPSWLTPPEPEAVNVILDPGLAFGTGTHPTTSLCLEWLDANIKSGDTVIDYGCGSGILAIAALKLGANQVMAIDHDPQALDATRQNGERNQLAPSELKTCLPDDFVPQQVDVVIANILAKPLIELAPRLSTFVKQGGQILLSGILIEQAEHVAEAYKPWFLMKNSVSKQEWVRLEGVRK